MRSSSGAGIFNELAVATNITSDMVKIHFQIMIVEGVVLLRIEHLQQRRRRITTEIHRHLVDLVKQEQKLRTTLARFCTILPGIEPM